MSVKRLLDCTPSDLARYTKAELLDAIAGSEGRVLACETIGLTPPLLRHGPSPRAATAQRLGPFHGRREASGGSAVRGA